MSSPPAYPTSPNSITDAEDIITIGWPASMPLPYSQSRSYPILAPCSLYKMQRIFVGPNLDPDLMRQAFACLSLIIDKEKSDAKFDGLCLTADRCAWTPEKAKSVLGSIQQNGFKHFELRVLDSSNGIENVTRSDAKFGRRHLSSFVSGPADSISRPEEVQRIQSLPNLGVVHILQPKGPLSTPEDVNACVSGIISILDDNNPKNPKHIRKCVLPLDFFVQTRDLLRVLAQYPDMEELELLSPTTFDLFHLLKSALSSNFLDSLLPPLSLLTSLQSLTLPISLITPQILTSISRFLNLYHLKVKPEKNINSIRHFLDAIEVAQILVQGTQLYSFIALAFLDLGLDDAENPQQVRPGEPGAERDLDSWRMLHLWLPGTFFHGDPLELERLYLLDPNLQQILNQ